MGAGYVANQIVDCDEFRRLVAELDPRCLVPAHAAINIDMAKIVVELKANVSAKI